MPNVSFDQSPGYVFKQSDHRQRNVGSELPPNLFETINISRGIRHSNDAFFNAFVSCNQRDFSLIPPVSLQLPTPLVLLSRYYMESDVPPIPMQSTPPNTPPYPNYPKGTVIIDSSPDGTANETFVPAGSMPPSIVKIPLAAFMIGTPPVEIHAAIGFNSIWPDSGLLGSLANRHFYLSAYSAQSWEFLWDGQVREFYQCQKTRFKLVSERVGFMAVAQLEYFTNPAVGLPEVQDFNSTTIETSGTFAANVWHNVPFPTAFNVNTFRFVVLDETPAQWSVRTGRPIA